MQNENTKQTFAKKTSQEILEDLLAKCDPEHQIFGGMLRDIYDPHNFTHAFKDIDVLITRKGYGKFRNITKTVGFLREVTQVMESYSVTNQLEIDGTSFSV